jgi:hypothetical protein
VQQKADGPSSATDRPSTDLDPKVSKPPAARARNLNSERLCGVTVVAWGGLPALVKVHLQAFSGAEIPKKEKIRTNLGQPERKKRGGRTLVWENQCLFAVSVVVVVEWHCLTKPYGLVGHSDRKVIHVTSNFCNQASV